ncbi:hypothetical protein CYMTET_7217 [Cymbomonas tetramitiformis]|uniref:Uncharacterized protein n=1 Tax=Cymbomonas tetramitiformis TaxID=36881 RepID=A0AAE0GW23_9CHLO|nr:hypothetical protein CYMTET_49157 [Cymbomonas tetramitiformis]KAK3285161.1 hypothetical protein CYMTET_7217 [Cymbomonas tetramitiformis]
MGATMSRAFETKRERGAINRRAVVKDAEASPIIRDETPSASREDGYHRDIATLLSTVAPSKISLDRREFGDPPRDYVLTDECGNLTTASFVMEGAQYVADVNGFTDRGLSDAGVNGILRTCMIGYGTYGSVHRFVLHRDDAACRLPVVLALKVCRSSNRQVSEEILMSDHQLALRRSVAADDEKAVKKHMQSHGILRLSPNDLQHAVRRGSVRTLEMYATDFDTNFAFDDPSDACHFIDVAIENDQLVALEWGMYRFVRRYPEGTDGTRYAAVLAARAGSTETLRWMLTGKYAELFHHAFPEFCLLDEAARCMQFETLRYLLETGAPEVRCRESRENVLRTLKETYDQKDLDSVLCSVKGYFARYEIEYETFDDIPKSEYR